MAAELQEQYPEAELRLIESSGGRFEVEADGTTVFSKASLGRHAEPGEVLRLIQDHLG